MPSTETIQKPKKGQKIQMAIIDTEVPNLGVAYSTMSSSRPSYQNVTVAMELRS